MLRIFCQGSAGLNSQWDHEAAPPMLKHMETTSEQTTMTDPNRGENSLLSVSMRNQKRSSMQNSSLGIELGIALGNKMFPKENCIENKINNSDYQCLPCTRHWTCCFNNKPRNENNNVLLWGQGMAMATGLLIFAPEVWNRVYGLPSILPEPPRTTRVLLNGWPPCLFASSPLPHPGMSSLRCPLREQEWGLHDIEFPGLVLHVSRMMAAEVQPECTAEVFVPFSRY